MCKHAAFVLQILKACLEKNVPRFLFYLTFFVVMNNLLSDKFSVRLDLVLRIFKRLMMKKNLQPYRQINKINN